MNKWKWEVQNYDFLEGIDYLKELNYYDKKSIHNLKHFTWVKQQGKVDELKLNSMMKIIGMKDFRSLQNGIDLLKSLTKKLGYKTMEHRCR